jgi:hypothetical protein
MVPVFFAQPPYCDVILKTDAKDAHDNASFQKRHAWPGIGRDAIREMFAREFAQADMVCQIENLFQDGDWVILEWTDPNGLRGCGFFNIQNDKIVFQRGYFNELSFLRLQGLPLPTE